MKLFLFLLIIVLSFARVGGASDTYASHASGDPMVVGHWDGPFDTGTIVGTHVTVLPPAGTDSKSKVLLIQIIRNPDRAKLALWTPPNIGEQGVGSFLSGYLLDNLSCSGHSFLADGRVIFIGGHLTTTDWGIKDTNIFDPFNLRLIEAAPMAYARWYPTSTTLPDGNVLATSGTSGTVGTAIIPEIYNPTNNTWSPLASAERTLPLYPWMFVLPSGKVFNAGANKDTKILNVTDGIWETETYDTNLGNRGEYMGTAVALVPGKVLIVGGDDPNDVNGWATNTAEIIDLVQNKAQWQYTGSMNYRRLHLNATLLPDGKVLVTGGTQKGLNVKSQAVRPAELYDPATGTWTEMTSMSRARVYHSSAFLLSDGRVVVAGTDNDKTLEIYSPSYLFKGERPSITLAPSTVRYGNTFEVGYTTAAGTSITKVSLIRPSAVTHSFNMDQRYVPLSFTVSGSTLTIQEPENANMAPPGYYMLFIVNDQGVPSIASWVKLE